jgi:hypothetical protein
VERGVYTGYIYDPEGGLILGYIRHSNRREEEERGVYRGIYHDLDGFMGAYWIYIA